ncbi:iron-sulfur cluster assembly protein [Bacillus massiliglaciei]|uniref:iron-sulfur cluster assembly protein n=1 Tax=Bacillus massiliglaciei TaxID=1816693 RepID=UPI000B32C270|nr:iron-sulfur cluster assembly protein [Bacillus massiliglaciei]
MNKIEEVNAQLEKVYDPELDQSLPELGFIEGIVISKGKVKVIFRLPTYWCSPNFAYIMAEDIQAAITELDWVQEVEVNLIDHCASEEINKGANAGVSFSESFKKLTDGNLGELRKTFNIKAYYARQEKLMRYLMKTGMTRRRIIELTVNQLEAMTLDAEGREVRERYLEKKERLNHTSGIAVTTPEDKPLSEEEFMDYLHGAKRTRMNMEFNAYYCRGLLEARYGLEPKNSNTVPLA